MKAARLVRVLALAGLAIACAAAKKAPEARSSGATKTKGSTAPAAERFPVIVKSDPAGTVEAHFDGEAPPADLHVPLRFGTTRLFFTFKGDKTALAFEPEGELHFSDWRFDIFSPDGKWVLLLQDRFGPYHVVSIDRLKDYLQGSSPPDKVVTVPRPAGQSALVHSDAHWVSPTEIEYTVGGETSEVQRATVP